MDVYGAEHERTLSHLDPEYRQMIEDHCKMLEANQDQEDNLIAATMENYSRRAISQTPKHQSIKQKLIAMIDRILGIPKG